MSAPPRADARVLSIVGNPKPASRTAAVAGTLADLVAAALSDTTSAGQIDLATLGPAVLDSRESAHAVATAAVDAADVLIVGSPVYKASFTGLLKVFLDSFPAGALTGVVAVPATVAGTPDHRLLADAALRTVLAALGASTPAPGLTLVESDLVHAANHAHDWVARHIAVVAAARPEPAAVLP